MSPRGPKSTYLASKRAVDLHCTFVNNVYKAMLEKGWTCSPFSGNRAGKPHLARLAKESGVPYRTVENLMRLDNQPTMVGAAQIAQALGESMDKLLGLTTISYTTPSGLTDHPDVGSTTSPRLVCVHSPTEACARCRRRWLLAQRCLNELYEVNRAVAREAWDAVNKGINLTPEERNA